MRLYLVPFLVLLAVSPVSAVVTGIRFDAIAGGDNGEVQFNNGGRFDGEPTVTYSTTTGILSVSSLSVAGLSLSTITTSVFFTGPEPFIDPKTRGAKGDGITDDTAAIQAIVDAYSGNFHIRFSSGVYILNDVNFSSKSYVTLTGSPGAIIRWGGTERIMSFEDCSHVRIEGLRFDNRGVLDNFGGVGLYRSSNVWIHNNHFYDSNVQPGGSNDRYAFFFGDGGEMSRNIYVTNNLIEDLQVEIDSSSNVVVQGNISHRAKKSAAIGAFSVNGGIRMSNYKIVDNIIVNPESTAIYVGIDPPSDSTCTFENFDISRNIIVWNAGIVTRGIVLGTLDNSQPTVANVFRDFNLVENEMHFQTTATVTNGMLFNGSPTANFTFSGFNVQNNRAWGNGTGQAFDLRELTSSTVSGNFAHNFSVGYGVDGQEGVFSWFNNIASSCTTNFTGVFADTLLRTVDIQDATTRQLRLSYSGAKYSDFQTDANGNLLVTPQNGTVSINGQIQSSIANTGSYSFANSGSNNSNTVTVAGARFATVVLNANTNAVSPGDASIRFQDNGDHKAEIGIDNSDGDKFKIDLSTTAGMANSSVSLSTQTAVVTISSVNLTGLLNVAGPIYASSIIWPDSTVQVSSPTGGAGSGMSIGGAVTGGTTGSVLFVDGGNLSQDNSSLFWNNSTNRLGVGTTAPAHKVSVGSGFDAGVSIAPTTATPSAGQYAVIYSSLTNTTTKLYMVDGDGNVSRLGSVQLATASITHSTVTNTISESTFTASVTFPANTLKVGDVIEVCAFGLYSTSGTVSTYNVRLKMNETALVGTGGVTFTASLINRGWNIRALLMVGDIGASGLIEPQGIGLFGTAGATANTVDMEATAPVIVDTTVPITVQLTTIWGSAATQNKISLRQLFVRINR